MSIDRHDQRHEVVISVGSNIDPQENCRRAEEILRSEHALLDRAAYIVTKPVGYQDQDDFLNGAYLVETSLSHEEFRRYLKAVEVRLGRQKSDIKSGPRVIDLDIISWDRRVVHDDLRTKEYVRIPVRELCERHGIELAGLSSR